MAARMRIAGRGWAYVGAILGGAVSIAANVAHSYVPPTGAGSHWAPQPGAVVGAVFWPVFLFIAIEILARYAWPAGFRWVAVRYLGMLPVAVVAAVVSYRHLSGLLHFYGEDPLTVGIGPLAVDGLMVMATGALIATGTRRHMAETVVTQATRAETSPAPAVQTSPATPADNPPVDAPVTAPLKPLLILRDEGADFFDMGSPKPAVTRTPRKTGRKPDTATAVARLRDRHPDMPTTEIAKRLKVSDRTVRRHLNNRTEPAADPTPVAA
jgi:hypothetical protein